jgi:hypothetical protein
MDVSGVSPVDIIPPWFSMLIYHLGDDNWPVNGRISEIQSHPIDTVIIIVTIINGVSGTLNFPDLT